MSVKFLLRKDIDDLAWRYSFDDNVTGDLQKLLRKRRIDWQMSRFEEVG